MVRRRRRRGRRAHDGGHEDEERWLLTYADMITLLMALFMVLFSISSVNVSKLRVLQVSLHDAFSGKILPGGKAIEETGAVDNTPKMDTEPPAFHQLTVATSVTATEQQSFERLKRAVDQAARREGVGPKVSTRVTQRGLAIDILTDGLLFDSGEADVKPAGLALLHRLAPVLGTQPDHRVSVEGHTDSQPIHSGTFPSNWELSGARASAVVRALVADGLVPARFEATGRAYLDPVASNATAAGRARNRRVEILLLRNGPGRAP